MDRSVSKRHGTSNHYRKNGLEVLLKRKKSILESKRPEKEQLRTKSFVLFRSNSKNILKEKSQKISKNAENKKSHLKSILKVKPVVKPKNQESQSQRPSILKNIDNERNLRNQKLVPRTDPSKNVTIKVFENEPDPSQSRRSSILKTNNTKSPSQLKSILKLPDREKSTSRYKSVLKVAEKDKSPIRLQSKLQVPEKEKSLGRQRSILNRSSTVNRRVPFGSKSGRSLPTHKSALKSKSPVPSKNITTFLKQGIAVPPNLTKTANRVDYLPRVSRKQRKLKEAVAKARANGRFDLLASLPQYGVPGMSLSDFALMLDQASPIPAHLKTDLPAELAREIFLKRIQDTRKERAKKLEMLIRQNPETAKKILEKVDKAAGIARSKSNAPKSNEVGMSEIEQNASNANLGRKFTLNPDKTKKDKTRKTNAGNPKYMKKAQKDKKIEDKDGKNEVKDKKIEDEGRRNEVKDKKIEDEGKRKVVKYKKIEDKGVDVVKNSKKTASLMNIFGRSKKREVVDSHHAEGKQRKKNDSIGKIKKISDDHEKIEDLGKKKNINETLGYKKIENLGKMKSDSPGKTKRPGDDLKNMAGDRAASNRRRK